MLQARGLRVTIQKFDPYINVDPGTLNPYEHGECFVTEDGAETDLDLGHYERYLNIFTSQANNVTTGKIYQTVINKEREGSYPPMGNSSDSGKEANDGNNNPFAGSVEQYQDTTGSDEVPANAKVRHPNRNVNKGEDKKTDKNSGKNNGKGKSQNSDDGQTATIAQELPGVLTKELFESLVSFRGEFCVSVYIPTHRSGVEVNQLDGKIYFAR